MDKRQEKKVDKLIQKISDKYNFYPGREYNINIRVKHDRDTKQAVRRIKKDFIDKPGNSRLGRDTHWENYNPKRTISLPRDPNIGTSIYELRDRKDFFTYFEHQYGNLPDGVYCSMTSLGKGHGMAWLYCLELRNGEVTWWKQKSNGTKSRNSSTYLALPQFFRLRDKYGV